MQRTFARVHSRSDISVGEAEPVVELLHRLELPENHRHKFAPEQGQRLASKIRFRTPICKCIWEVGRRAGVRYRSESMNENTSRRTYLTHGISDARAQLPGVLSASADPAVPSRSTSRLKLAPSRYEVLRRASTFGARRNGELGVRVHFSDSRDPCAAV